MSSNNIDAPALEQLVCFYSRSKLTPKDPSLYVPRELTPQEEELYRRKQPDFPPFECNCGQCGHEEEEKDEEEYEEEGEEFEGGEIDPNLLSMLTQWALQHMH